MKRRGGGHALLPMDETVKVVRRHRAVSLGMPSIRPAAPAAGVTR